MTRVLVIDDIAASRLALNLELTALGLEVVEAETGYQGVALLQRGCYAAVITDVWMPGQDGLQVVRAIHDMDATIPTWVITGGGPGLSFESVTALAELWGAEAVLLKPFDAAALARAVADRITGTGIH